MMQQYQDAKARHPGMLLLFRMGDFYEMFDDDAEIVARELEIALTRRDFGRGEKSPMAGIPHHAADGYIARLVSKGKRKFFVGRGGAKASLLARRGGGAKLPDRVFSEPHRRCDTVVIEQATNPSQKRRRRPRQ